MTNIGEIDYGAYEAQKTEIRNRTEKSIRNLLKKGILNEQQCEKLLKMYLQGEVSFGDDGLTEEEAQEFTAETYDEIEQNFETIKSNTRSKTLYIIQPGDTAIIIATKMGLNGEEAKEFARTIQQNAQKKNLYYKFKNNVNGFKVGDIIELPGDYRNKIDALRDAGMYQETTSSLDNAYIITINRNRNINQNPQDNIQPEEPTVPDEPPSSESENPIRTEEPSEPENTQKPITPSKPDNPPAQNPPTEPEVPEPTMPELNQKPPFGIDERRIHEGPTEAQIAARDKVYDEAVLIVKTLGHPLSPNNPVLKRISPQNVVFVIKMYKDTYGVELAKELIKSGDKKGAVVYNKLCSNLYKRAKELGIEGIRLVDAYTSASNPEAITKWINSTYAKVFESEKKKNPAFVSNADYEVSRQRIEYENTQQLRTDSTKIARELHRAIYDRENIIGNIKDNLTNNVTIGILKKITPANVAFVIKMYKDTYKKDLAKDIDNEIGLGLKEIKEYLCSKLVTQAKKLNLSVNLLYQNITDIDRIISWIDNISRAIITAMDGNSSTLPVQRADENVTVRGNGIRVKSITNGPMFVEADITKIDEEYNKKGEKIKSKEYFKDGKVVQIEQFVLIFKGNKLVKSYPLYDSNGNKNQVPEGAKIVTKRTLLKAGTKTHRKPVKSDITEAVPMEIKLPKNANENAKKFARALERNKARLMKLLKIDNDTYNRLAKLAMAIAEQETNFGTNTRYGKYYIAATDTVGTAIISRGAGTHGTVNQIHNLSFGPTQIKFDLHIQDSDVKEFWKQLGITNGAQLYNMENSAVATIALLSVLNKRVQSKEIQDGIDAANGRVITNEGWEKKNGTLVKTYNSKPYVNEADEDDAIAYMWNMGPLSVKYGSMDPLGYEYTRNVRIYKNKYTIQESDADRKAARAKSQANKAQISGSKKVTFSPMDNNGPIGSIIFLPVIYSNKPINNNDEIKILETELSKNKKIKQSDKEELVKAVKNGELSFEFRLTAKEVASLTQSDVDKLLANLRRLKQKIEQETNIKFSDGINPEEAKILQTKCRRYIRSTESNFKREYLNSHSKRVKLSDVNSANVAKINNKKAMISTHDQRKGFVGNIPDNGINTAGTSAASAALAKFAQSTATTMTQNAKKNGKSPGGMCMTGFRQAIRAAGIDDSDLKEGKPRASVAFFERHPDMFEEVKWIDIGNGNGRQINSTDLPKLPAGYIVIWVPDPGFSEKEGHISITNGNGLAYSDETDNLDWGTYSGKDHTGKDASGKGEHGHFRVFRLTNKWSVDPKTGKLVFSK